MANPFQVHDNDYDPFDYFNAPPPPPPPYNNMPSPMANDRWQVYNLHDAFKPRPPIEYIIEEVIEKGSVSIVYGAPGSLKSMILADACICVAAGIEWLKPLPGEDCRIFETNQAGVMWVDLDNGTRRTHERFEALSRSRNLPMDTPLFYTSMPSPWLDAMNNHSMKDLADRIRHYDAGMVVVDNLGQVTGNVNENEAEMGKVMSKFRRLAEATNAAIVLIHHQRKSNGVVSRAGESLRGHSSIEAAIDLALLVMRKPQSSDIAIKSTKERGIDIPPFEASFSYVHKANSKELESAYFYGIPVDDKSSSYAIRRTVISYLKANPDLSQTDLIAGVQPLLDKVGKHRIRDMILTMVNDGKLEEVTGYRGAKIYNVI